MIILLLIVLILAAPVQKAPTGQTGLAGTWDGSIDVPGAPLEIAVTFLSGPEGLRGAVDIPKQGATGLTLRAITLSDDVVHFELATGGPVAIFDGRLEGDRMMGSFTQGPFKGTFALTRRPAAPPAPTSAPPPYRVEPLTVTNGDVTLAGTLTMPRGAGPVPAVVLITGSGPQNRDEDVFGFKVFAVLADHLTRQGIAVYRHDDRGVGESTGDLSASTSADFAVDALAAIARLKDVPGIAADRIGLLGHSEGGIAAAIAAARSSDVAFVVMLAGTGVPGDRVLRQQARDIATAGGATPQQVERIVAAHRAATEAVLKGASPDDQQRALRALAEAQVDAVPPERQGALGDRAAYLDKVVKAGAAQMGSPWMKFLLSFDPATALRKVSVPIYAAFGELDTQVPPSLHEGPVREALGNNPRATIKIYAGANHLFQRAHSGLVTEYKTLEKAFVPGLLDDLSKWIPAARR